MDVITDFFISLVGRLAIYVITMILFSPVIMLLIVMIVALKNKRELYKNRTYQANQTYQTHQAYQNTTENILIYPYKKKSLLTQTENHFYQTLKEECDERNLLICPKVRMEDYIEVTTETEKLKYRGYIKSRHIDFIICDNQLNVIAGLELDDYSHNRADRQKVDELKDNIFKRINIPLIRVNVTSGKYREQIISVLDYVINHT